MSVCLQEMYRLFSRVLRAEPPQQHLHKAPSPPRCKAVSLQSKRSLAVQTWIGRSGSGSRAEFVNTRYWESFATWWQLIGEKREIPAQGCELRSGNGKPGGQSSWNWGRIAAEGLDVPAHTQVPAKAPGSGQHHPKPELCKTQLAQPSLPCVILGFPTRVCARAKG